MINLMKLELRKNNIRVYMTSVIVIILIMLGFVYLFAFAPSLEPNDQDMQLFAGYNNIVVLVSILNTCIFSVLASVMHCRFVIDEYIGKRATMIFTYPINRGKVFLAKILVVSGFISIGMVGSNILIFSIFFTTELIEPFALVSEALTVGIYLKCIMISIIMGILATGIGCVSIALGFIRKSIPVTIITAVLIDSFMSNILVLALENVWTIMCFTIVVILIGIISVGLVMNKINHMEVE